MRLDGHDPAAIAEAADLLAAGALVAFPTETVYGLGARADDDAAVEKIYAAKGRPADHPLIVHVVDAAAAARWAAPWTALAARLADAFWPGPVTLIVPRSPALGTTAAGGHPTIGLRCPAHPVAGALLAAAAERGVAGVAAPSANRFGRVSPTLAAHVESEFDGAIPVLDGGACDVGIESAIVDCTRDRPVLLRPGIVSAAEIEAAAGMPLMEIDADAPRASGTLASHYAPRATVRLMATPTLRTALEVLGQTPLRLAVYSRTLPLDLAPSVRHRRMPAGARQAAHELFSVMRELDAEGAHLIWVEEPPPDPAWDGVRDRLRRAAAT
ncbi:MAG: threonylcarbamoyl-AMP synthase [Proteobacteria bacterium]|nr:threonylcarbamoyl-AMP synthase [Pseudomonadota bacterium]